MRSGSCIYNRFIGAASGSPNRSKAILTELEELMPIFEYRCESCGHKFEAIVFGEQTAECPKCHTEKLEKQLSTFAVNAKSSFASPASGCGQSNCCRMNGGSCDVN
jgi:putative FmdB family regulatory protein